MNKAFKIIRTFLALIMSIIITNSVLAKDFGTQGMVFAVTEEGFIAMLKRKLENIDIAEHQKKMQELAKERIESPTPISGISKAIKTISHSFDPSYILDEDVRLPCGKLIYPAGTTINPLDHISWQGSLAFIDARDKSQIEWVIKIINQNNSAKNENIDANDKNIKIVLVAGKPFELEQQLNMNIYFDQFGELTTKFNIQHVPAIVAQEGKILKITEFKI